jgi:pimeloyl-ACP methyl ester carboxylesterase
MKGLAMNNSRDDSRPLVERTVRAGQIELFVAERGEGMPVVFAHGFPLDYTMWENQLCTLGANWRVIAPDLRGFGRSQVGAGAATMEAMADDLAALLPALGIDQPIVLVGLSMGGYVAFQFWRKHRKLLRGLVLCDTRSIADTAEAAAGRRKLAAQTLAEGPAPVAAGMLPKLFGPHAREHDPATIEATRQVILSTLPQGIAAALEGMAARPDATSYLAEIALPTLVVVGQDDAISSVDEMRTLAHGIKGSEFVVIPRSGHMTPLENPAEFNEALEQFLTRVERGGPQS